MSIQKKVCVVVGATSKWNTDGINTKLVYGNEKKLQPEDYNVGARFGVGGAIAQKFASEGFMVILTTRTETNATGLSNAIKEQGGSATIVQLDLASEDSIKKAFENIRTNFGEPDIVVFNAGYIYGRDMPRGTELMEYVPTDMFDKAMDVASRGPFLIAKEILPKFRERGYGSLFFSNNNYGLRGKQRAPGMSVYFPRVMMRTIAQTLVEEYTKFGIHIANITIDGLIDSPGTRELPNAKKNPDIIINPMSIANAYWYLHSQDKSCFTHELQLTPFPTKPSF